MLRNVGSAAARTRPGFTSSGRPSGPSEVGSIPRHLTGNLPCEFRWLATTEHVERGNEGLRRQRALVAELESAGRDASTARKLLRLLEGVQRHHEADLRCIEAEFNADGTPNDVPAIASDRTSDPAVRRAG
jgi:hypothetical protein